MKYLAQVLSIADTQLQLLVGSQKFKSLLEQLEEN